MSRYTVGLDRELAASIENGEVCVECGSSFVASHEKTTACAYCWSRLSADEKKVVAKATHEEANVAAWKTVARAAKKRKQEKTA